MTDWIMIIITAVYVVATIFISYFNHQSAKATREQVSESVRQFNEANRAYVTITFESIRNGWCVLRFQNYGKQVAKNVRIRLSQDFINQFTDADEKNRVNNLIHSSFIIGINQFWYFYMFSGRHLDDYSKPLLNIQISYEDDNARYNEEISYDLSQYNWAVLFESELDKMTSHIKGLSEITNKMNDILSYQNDSLNSIVSELKNINLNGIQLELPNDSIKNAIDDIDDNSENSTEGATDD
jgi:hypothetical protein